MLQTGSSMREGRWCCRRLRKSWGAEHILARRAVNKEVAEKIFAAVREIEELARVAGVPDIRKSNPAADNIKGGITTLAEKALGAIKKAGSKPLKGRGGFLRKSADR